MLQGYRTIFVNLVALGAAWLASHYGIIIDENSQTALVVTLVTLSNIGLRLLTKTPVFTKEQTLGNNPQAAQAASLQTKKD